MKTEGELRDRAYGLSWALLFAMLGAIGAVSIATPFLHVQYTQRWFAWPNIIFTAPVPIAVAAVTVLLLMGGAAGWLLAAAGLALDFTAIAVTFASLSARRPR